MLLLVVPLVLFALITWQVLADGPLLGLDERLSDALVHPDRPSELLSDLGNVTVAVTTPPSSLAAGRPDPPPPRRPPRPPDTQRFWRALPLGTRVPMPCRSAAGEWQLLQLAAKKDWPALASPTTTSSSTSGPGGGPP